MYKHLPSRLARSVPALRSSTRAYSSRASATPSATKDFGAILLGFAGVTIGFSLVADSIGLKSKRQLLLDSTNAPSNLENAVAREIDPVASTEFDNSDVLYATGGLIKEFKGPIYSRNECTVVIVIGGPRAGKSEQVKRIEERFNCQREEADSDIYSDIALNLPTAHLSSPTGSSKLRIVVDDFARSCSSPLDEALQFEKDVAPILCFVFVDCPLNDALKRAKNEAEKEVIKAEYKDFYERFTPLIKHYRDKANFLEITGQWPAHEQWEQVEAKLESAFVLETRGEL